MNYVHLEVTTSQGDTMHELESNLANLNLFVDLYNQVVWLIPLSCPSDYPIITRGGD